MTGLTLAELTALHNSIKFGDPVGARDVADQARKRLGEICYSIAIDELIADGCEAQIARRVNGTTPDL